MQKDRDLNVMNCSWISVLPRPSRYGPEGSTAMRPRREYERPSRRYSRYMNPHPTFSRNLILALGLLAAIFTRPAWAAGKTYGDISTVLNVSALQPGNKATLAVVFDVKEGFHTQSHTPGNMDYNDAATT